MFVSAGLLILLLLALYVLTDSLRAKWVELSGRLERIETLIKEVHAYPENEKWREWFNKTDSLKLDEIRKWQKGRRMSLVYRYGSDRIRTYRTIEYRHDHVEEKPDDVAPTEIVPLQIHGLRKLDFLELDEIKVNMEKRLKLAEALGNNPEIYLLKSRLVEHGKLEEGWHPFVFLATDICSNTISETDQRASSYDEIRILSED